MAAVAMRSAVVAGLVRRTVWTPRAGAGRASGVSHRTAQPAWALPALQRPVHRAGCAVGDGVAVVAQPGRVDLETPRRSRARVKGVPTAAYISVNTPLETVSGCAPSPPSCPQAPPGWWRGRTGCGRLARSARGAGTPPAPASCPPPTRVCPSAAASRGRSSLTCPGFAGGLEAWIMGPGGRGSWDASVEEVRAGAAWAGGAAGG